MVAKLHHSKCVAIYCGKMENQGTSGSYKPTTSQLLPYVRELVAAAAQAMCDYAGKSSLYSIAGRPDVSVELGKPSDLW